METKATAATWKERVEAWLASGLASKEFAEREGFSQRSLVWWSSELQRRAAKKKSKATPSFLPVAVTDSRYAPNAMIEVELASGHLLRVERGFDVETVKRLVDAIGGGR